MPYFPFHKFQWLLFPLYKILCQILCLPLQNCPFTPHMFKFQCYSSCGLKLYHSVPCTRYKVILHIQTNIHFFLQVACYLVILLTYLMVTNFFWMFVEGLYLYMLVVKTFSVEKIKLQTYVFIGWGMISIEFLLCYGFLQLIKFLLDRVNC